MPPISFDFANSLCDFGNFLASFGRFCSNLRCFSGRFCAFLGCISPVMSDFNLQIFGGVTRAPPRRAYPPPGTSCDLCAKFVLYAMKRRKNHVKTARKQPARRIFPVFELSARQKCKNSRQPAKIDAKQQPAARQIVYRVNHIYLKRDARLGGKGSRRG